MANLGWILGRNSSLWGAGMDFPEKLWLELSQAGLEQPGTVENVLAHGRGGTGWVFSSYQTKEASKMLRDNLRMITKNDLPCPGTFVPPPNPPVVLQEKSVISSVCGCCPGQLGKINLWLQMENLEWQLWGEKCPGAWWEWLEIPGAVLCGAENFSFMFCVELRTLCTGASPSLQELNLPLVWIILM